jgi:Putative zinc ribbon domain
MSTQQLGPFCQSCGMPLTKPDDFGTDVTGYRINDYCHYCFAAGAFTAPQATLQGMIDKTVDVMVRKNIMPASEARVLMSRVIPGLKRWRSAPVGAAHP